MADPFQKLADSVAARLGAEAVLRPGAGDEVVLTGINKAIFHRGVAILGEYGELVARRDVAAIPSGLSPKVGDPLTAGGKDYVLDSLETDDGYTARFFVRPG